MIRRRRLPRWLGPWSVRAGLLLFSLWTLAPIGWLVVSSLMRQQALTATPPDFSPSAFTLVNYLQVMQAAVALGRGFANSLIVALATTLVALAIGAPAAYALARLRIPGSGPILLMILATQMFPGIVVAIPLFIAMSRLGLIDSRVGLVIVYLSFNLPIVIWVLRGFFLAIPPGLERAAAVDGASVLQVFRLIVLPISLPPLMATAVFAFIESWNEFFFALILTRQSAQTAPLVISQFAGQYQTVFGQMMAAATMAVAPVVILAIMFRNSIMRGFTDGMVKG
jgi:multiple sugar transport system permease protein